MGVMLYRKGDTHTIRGIRCEMEVFPVGMLQVRLSEGWEVKPPIDAPPKPKVAVAFKPPRPKPKPAQEIDKLSNRELRNLAKIQGIPKWKTRRLSTLRRMLKDAAAKK